MVYLVNMDVNQESSESEGSIYTEDPGSIKTQESFGSTDAQVYKSRVLQYIHGFVRIHIKEGTLDQAFQDFQKHMELFMRENGGKLLHFITNIQTEIRCYFVANSNKFNKETWTHQINGFVQEFAFKDPVFILLAK